MQYLGVFVVVNEFFHIFIQAIKNRDEKLIENY